ncbi:FluC/FEX family fluoride channel [Nocardioides caldifontis]|uniref:FluC/FEX family fluoride channel n=1 Tax=Nocardioides caldifontis TaxID=2588938 RepID=UPI0011DF583C|nr:CrcB family protein [Nocardioides caldifontis]
MSRPAPRPTVVAAVAVGGALGALARWALGEAFATPGGSFPWATFGVNVVGSALLALLPAVAGVRSRPALVALLGPGVLGGFTTLSAYSEETRALLAGGHPGVALAYVVGTLLTCLAAVVVADRLSTAGDRALFAAEEGES